MALISTVINNYSFADSILQQLTKREWIKNDSTEYDYLNHYYVTQARIAVYLHKNFNTTYLDSIENVFTYSKNLNDSVYYSGELIKLYNATGKSSKENYYAQINNKAFNTFNSSKSVKEVQDKLYRLEITAEAEKRKSETEKAQGLKQTIYLLSVLLLAIGILTFFLDKKNRQSKITNEQLKEKNQQNELLNKEIQHRVKIIWK